MSDGLKDEARSAGFRAGEHGSGEFRCAGCGYGIVVVSHALPTCPMCSGELWETSAWSPFRRAYRDETVEPRTPYGTGRL